MSGRYAHRPSLRPNKYQLELTEEQHAFLDQYSIDRNMPTRHDAATEIMTKALVAIMEGYNGA